MKSVFHPEAREEFLASVDWYNLQAPGLGADFADSVQTAVSLVEAFPLGWTEVEEGIRRCLVQRFPYGILYSVEGDVIVIYAVMHLHREPGYWKNRL